MTEASYSIPPEGWTCFFCGEHFTTYGAARDHFGAEPIKEAGCQIKIGAERGLLMQLRKAEAVIAQYMDDDTPAYRRMAEMQSRHGEALRVAEELGYERGLRDGRIHKDE